MEYPPSLFKKGNLFGGVRTARGAGGSTVDEAKEEGANPMRIREERTNIQEIHLEDGFRRMRRRRGNIKCCMRQEEVEEMEEVEAEEQERQGR